MLTNTINLTNTDNTINSNDWFTKGLTVAGSTYSYYLNDIDLKKKVEECLDEINKKNKEKEFKKMANPFGLKCGQIADDSACLTTKGIAVRNTNNQYVMYHDGAIEDVTPYVIKGNYLYAMPVAYKDIECGNIIIYNDKYYTVIGNNDTPDSFDAIELNTGEVKTLLPAKSPFGFNYLMKVLSPISLDVSEDEPFGELPLLMIMNEGNNKNLLPLLMLSKDMNKKIDPMIWVMMANI